MPLVNVCYQVTEHGAPPLLLKKGLATIVALRLSVEGTPWVKPEDVIVMFQEYGHHDVHTRDVAIIVTAHNFAERVTAHAAITTLIAEDISKTLEGFSYSVIVNLTPLEWKGRA